MNHQEAMDLLSDRDRFAEWRKQNPDEVLPLDGRTLTDRVFEQWTFGPIDLRNAVLDGVQFSDCDLTGALLKRANLRGARFERVNLTKAVLQGATATDAIMTEVELTNATLTGANFNKSNWKNCAATGGNFSSMQLSGAVLLNVTIKGANVGGVQLQGARLDTVDFSGSDLSGAQLASATVAPAEPGTCDFSKTNLRGANLKDGHFDSALFVGADLRGAKLQEASLVGADLRTARLSGAQLTNTVVTNARIRRYDLEDVRAQNYCGLLPSQIESMKVEDGYEELSLFLGGFRALLHMVGVALWLVPQLVLVAKAVSLSIVSGMLGDNVIDLPIWQQIWGYVKSGLYSPIVRDDGSWHYPWKGYGLFALLWLALLAYNVARLVLVYYVKRLEHQHRVKGFHPLVEKDGLIAWILKWGPRLILASVLLAAVHFVLFLLSPYPVLLR